VEKQYLTLVLGNWPHGTKLIDAPLATQNRSGGERVVKVDARGKESRSTFIPVDFFGNMATLMQVQLDTGRTHQIRVHAAHAGHPVAGDDKYATREDNAAMLEAGLTRLFLHAQSLSFEWPGGKQYAFSAPLPPDLAAFIDSLGNLKRKRKKASDAATARRVGQARRAAGPRTAR
jgi:23S rRNA pseudouridine955/2504/2580 synthase